MTDWAIPQQAKLKYTQLFNLHDRSRGGFLSGIQCRDILMQSGLPRNILAEIWNLSDIDGDGQLTREEFILAMHLTNQVRAGQTLPPTLPADLVPPSYRRTRSISATSVHSATSAASSMSSGAINDDQSSHKSTDITGGPITLGGGSVSIMSSNSFEDKRRENFEKGRAELERRRLKIIEQQTSILNEQLVRCKKDVAEAKSKIDSMRSDRDTKAGLITSLEAQLQAIRDRKAFLDHEELQIIAIAKDLNLVNSAHSADLDQQATIAKQESIDKMREQLAVMQCERDATLKKVSEAQVRIEEAKKELKSVTEEASKSYSEYKEQISKASTLKQQFIEESKSKPIDLDSIWNAAPSPQVFVTDRQASESRAESATIFPQSTIEDPSATKINSSASTKESSFEPFSVNNSTSSKINEFNNNNTNSPGFSVNIGPSKPFGEQQSAFDDLTSNSFNDANFGGEASTRKKMYRAVYAFDARNPDELTISPGDIIVGSEEVCEPGWLSGMIGERSGLFPEAYVEPLPDSERLTSFSGLNLGDTANPAETNISNEVTSLASFASQDISAQQKSYSTNMPTIVKYKVVYAFDARNMDELTINPGDIITGVEGPHEPGWLMGELNGQRGLFPEAYVEKLAEAQVEQTTTEPTGTLRRGSSSGSLRSKKSRAKKAEVATVIANYRALGQEQLNLEKGQLVLIRRKMDSGWWEGELQIKDQKRSAGTNPDTNPNPNTAQSIQRLPSSGDHDDELDHLISELLHSEWDYVNDLRLCQSVYIFPLSNSFEVGHIFTNWNQLIQMHENSLMKLSDGSLPNASCMVAKKYNELDYRLVLDTFLNLFNSITELYVDFCSRHCEASRQLEAKIASDIRFKQLVSESQRKLSRLIEQQNQEDDIGALSVERARALRNSNLPLTSFLLKPMQRITKYGLLFDRMLKLSEKRETRHGGLRALLARLKQAAESLCRQVNEACRLKEDDEDNRRRLRWCQSHIRQQSSGLAADGFSLRSSFNNGSPLNCVDLRPPLADPTPVELIQFNSNTNCLGPRRFIKAASLMKLRSGRELVAFLFNDFLLLTQVKGGASLRVEDVFRSERAQQAYYKFYRAPLLLEDLQLDNFDNERQAHSLSCPSLNSLSSSALGSGLSKEQEAVTISFLDRSSGSIYNLVTMSPKERDAWRSSLEERVTEAQRARAAVTGTRLTVPSRRLSASESLGRLFVTILELVRTTSKSNSASVNAPDLNTSWERRISAVNQVDSIQNLCLKMQLRLYRRALDLVDESERREVVPLSEEFCTNRVIVSELRRQPTMADMNETMSNLDLQRDVFKFELNSTQFLLGRLQAADGHEYLDIELVDESRFRETQLVARKRISIDQLLGRTNTATELSPGCSKSTQSGRSIQAIKPNRPVEMSLKLKACEIGRNQSHASPTGGRKHSGEERKFVVKLRLHLQMFCDIQDGFM